MDGDRSNNWKVTLLGPSAAGKTCYLGSLYAFHGDSGEEDEAESSDAKFFIRGDDALTRGNLGDLADQLLATPIQLPTQTEGLNDYNISLCLGDDLDVIKRPLTLIDHRGEALQGSTDPVRAREFDDLIDELCNSDAFVVFVAAEHLLNGDAHARGKAMAWGTINDILSNVAAKLDKRDFLPVVIAVSKYDMVDSKDVERVNDTLDALIGPLTSRLANAVFYICPVSVIREVRTRKKKGVLGTARYERNLLNLSAPFLFTAAGVILRNAALIAADTSVAKDARDELRSALTDDNQGSFWDRVANFFGGLKKRVQIFVIDRQIKRKVRLTNDDIAFARGATNLLDSKSITGTRFVANGTESSLKSFVSSRVRRIKL